MKSLSLFLNSVREDNFSAIILDTSFLELPCFVRLTDNCIWMWTSYVQLSKGSKLQVHFSQNALDASNTIILGSWVASEASRDLLDVFKAVCYFPFNTPGDAQAATAHIGVTMGCGRWQPKLCEVQRSIFLHSHICGRSCPAFSEVSGFFRCLS